MVNEMACSKQDKDKNMLTMYVHLELTWTLNLHSHCKSLNKGSCICFLLIRYNIMLVLLALDFCGTIGLEV